MTNSLGSTYSGRVERAGVVVVDRLEDRVAGGEQLQVLLHDVDVVAVRVQGGEREMLALGPVVAVVVIHAHRRAAIRAEGLGPGRTVIVVLPGRAVARDRRA